MGTARTPVKKSEATEDAPSEPQSQQVQIPADVMIRKLQQQRAELHNQLDMMSIMLEQKDEQIAALLAEKEG